MENKEKKEKIRIKLKNIGMDKLVLLVFAGILLIFASMPSQKKEEISQQESSVTEEKSYEQKLESRLKTILEGMDGVGTAEVMITFEGSEEKVIDKNLDVSDNSLSEQDKEGGSRTSKEEKRKEETVLLNNGSGNGEPYVIKELSPAVEGVIVLADGGGTPAVVTEINEAIQALFDISPHKIKVLKRKNEDG